MSEAAWGQMVWLGSTPPANQAQNHHPEVVRLCVDAYLRHVSGIPASIDSIEADIRDMRSRLTPGGLCYDKMPSGGGKDLADALQAIEDKQSEWAEQVNEWLDEWAACKDLCRPVNPNRHVLWLRSVEWRGMTWARMGMELRRHPEKHGGIVYSERTLKAMCNLGREELYPLMPAKWRTVPIPKAI